MTAIEVITSVQRRRGWSRDEKLRIVAESAQPERTASQVARAHGIAPGQLFTWRRQLQAAALADGTGEGGFVPVRVAEASASMPCSTVALPSIAQDFRPAASTQLWIVDVYSLVLAALLVAMGSLGDRIGRRKMLLIGAAGFAVVSFAAAQNFGRLNTLSASVATGLKKS